MRVKLTKESERHLMSRTSGESTMRIEAIPLAPKDMVLSEGKIGTVSHIIAFDILGLHFNRPVISGKRIRLHQVPRLPGQRAS